MESLLLAVNHVRARLLLGETSLEISQQLFLAACAAELHAPVPGEIVRVLLEARANTKFQVAGGATPFALACEVARFDTALLILEHERKAGLDMTSIDVPLNSGATPLHFACQRGNHRVVRFLVAQGADLNQPRGEGGTPLFAACQDGQLQCAKLVLGGRADVNRRKGNTQTTPLMAAAMGGHAQLVLLLLSAKADVHAIASDGSTALFLLRASKNIKAEQKLQCDSLLVQRMTAEAAGTAPLARTVPLPKMQPAEWVGEMMLGPRASLMLVRAGHLAEAQINEEVQVTDGKRGTLLFHACTLIIEIGPKIVQALLEVKAHACAHGRLPDGRLLTPLIMACQFGNAATVELLLQHGAAAEIDLSPTDVPHALMQCCFPTNRDKLNPIHRSEAHPPRVATLDGLMACANLLLDNKADIESRDSAGYTCLIAAAEWGSANAVQQLLRRRADIYAENVREGSGYTALMAAVNAGHPGCVRLLLDAGASRMTKWATTDGAAPLNATACAWQGVKGSSGDERARHLACHKMLVEASASLLSDSLWVPVIDRRVQSKRQMKALTDSERMRVKYVQIDPRAFATDTMSWQEHVGLNADEDVLWVPLSLDGRRWMTDYGRIAKMTRAEREKIKWESVPAAMAPGGKPSADEFIRLHEQMDTDILDRLDQFSEYGAAADEMPLPENARLSALRVQPHAATLKAAYDAFLAGHLDACSLRDALAMCVNEATREDHMRVQLGAMLWTEIPLHLRIFPQWGDPTFFAGVRPIGLQSKPELNGLPSHVTGPPSEDGRVPLTVTMGVNGSISVRVKLCNLRPLGECSYAARDRYDDSAEVQSGCTADELQVREQELKDAVRSEVWQLRQRAMTNAVSNAATLRTQGNDAIRAGNHKVAAEAYDSAVNLLASARSDALAAWPLILCLSNRAAANLGLGRHEEATDDCATVRMLIDEWHDILDPNEVKALEEKLRTREQTATRQAVAAQEAAAHEAKAALEAMRKVERREAQKKKHALAAAERAKAAKESLAAKEREASRKAAAQLAHEQAALHEAVEREAKAAEEARRREEAIKEREAAAERRRLERMRRAEERAQQAAAASAAAAAEEEAYQAWFASRMQEAQDRDERMEREAREEEEMHLAMLLSRQAFVEHQQKQRAAEPSSTSVPNVTDAGGPSNPGTSDETCSVCLETFEEGAMLRPCGRHPLHKDCYLGWKKQCRDKGHAMTCPECRNFI